jgi:anti-sigma B factor antagonist
VEIKVEDIGAGVAVLRLDGKLNMVSAVHFRDAVNSSVSEGFTRLSVDLKGVDFIDSSGLGALISGLKATRMAGGDLRIAAPTTQVQLVLQLTNMDRVLMAYEDAETAFAHG